MISLSNYLQQIPTVDGHIHLFNYTDFVESPLKFDKQVCFMDVEFDKEGNAEEAYDRFIKEKYNSRKHILLCTAQDPADIASIFKNHKNSFQGFGELKLYDKYQDQEVPYKKISYLRTICKLSAENGNLPVYVHWELTSDSHIKFFENVLKSYPQVPIVLCHCGMNGENNADAYYQCQRLAQTYDNLWLDISYVALDYFAKEPMKLCNLPMNKLIVGSDLNNKIFGPNHVPEDIEHISRNLDVVRSHINSDKNICNLFPHMD